MKNFYTFLVVIIIVTSGFAQLQPVKYNEAEQVLNGYKIVPENTGNEKPGILILPAWMGIDQHAKDTAEKLAKLGYYAFIADIYGEGKYPKNVAEAGKQAGYYKKNMKEYQKRINLALIQLVRSGANANNIIVIGYCFGGNGALIAARAGFNVRGVVSFHGGLDKDATTSNNPILAKVLVLHGAEDPYESKEEIATFQQEMRDSKADWQMIFYSDAVHAFTDPAAGNDNSKGTAFNEKAAKRSWEHMKLFLEEVLKK